MFQMTKQLQLAVRLVSMSRAELTSYLRAEAQGLGLRPLAGDEVDPLEVQEAQEAQKEGRAPWTLEQRQPFAPTAEEPDVWVEGVSVFANGSGERWVCEREGEAAREGLWLLRAVRQRHRTYEKVAACLCEGNELASPVKQTVESVAERIGLHVATVERVVAAGVLQSHHGVLRFSALTR
ncbi:MAG: hypothetical protein GQE15_00545 [Archangiaceae bacterium]|nr:hypothetical protein [Archangiaceae bacterium]